MESFFQRMEQTVDDPNCRISGASGQVLGGARVRSGVAGIDRVDHQNASARTDPRSRNARLERRVTVERPADVERCVAFERHALGLSCITGVQRRIAKIERNDLRGDWRRKTFQIWRANFVFEKFYKIPGLNERRRKRGGGGMSRGTT